MLKLLLIIFIKILSINRQSVVMAEDYYGVFSPCKNEIFKTYPKVSDDSFYSWIGVIEVNEYYMNLSAAIVELKLNAEAAITVHPEAGEIIKSDNETKIINFLRPDNGYTTLKFKVEGHTKGIFPNILNLSFNSEKICEYPRQFDSKLWMPLTESVTINDNAGKVHVHTSRKTNSETCTFGQRKILYEGLITNDDVVGDWPWHAALFHKTGTSLKYACGGTLLNTNTILTAAHCVVESEHFVIPQRILIKLGLHKRLLAGRNMQEFLAHKIIPHEEYDFDFHKNDIALIQLATEAIFTSYVQPICLWPKDQTDLQTVINEIGIVVGWGFTEEQDAASETLRQAKMPIVDSFKCLNSNRKFFGLVLTEKNYCAGFRNGTRVYNGGSGGGMIFLRDNVYWIRGIASLCIHKLDEGVCNPYEYIVFTDVAKYLDWIGNKISKFKTQMPSETSDQRKILFQGLITNGDHSKKRAWPWHAALSHVKGVSVNYVCGGTLLNTNTILTAAHCVVENAHFMLPERILIKLGLHKRLLGGRNVQEFLAHKIIPHEEYDFDLHKNNIALIQLATEAIFTSHVQPICLWPKNETDLQNVINENGIVVSWGFIEEKHAASEILRQVKMPIVDSFKCLNSNRNFFGLVLTEKNYCAGFINGTSVCKGDAGGGMIFLRDNVYRIRGIVSLGVAKTDESVCNPHEYTLFTDVAKYFDWIQNKIYISQCKTQMSSETCGQRKILFQGLITNGDHSKKGDWPWHAALFHVKGASVKYACGGTLLNTNTILTAAHCVVENERFVRPERIFIKLGLHDRLLAGRNVQDFPAYKIIPHEEYDFDFYKNDIALIQLAKEAIFTSYVQPICLWPKDQTDLQTVINENGIVVGWGFTEKKHEASDILNQAKMPIVDPLKCLASNRDFFGAIITENNFCAGFRNGTSVCNGDSGGGMIFLRNNAFWIRGIVSVGPLKIDENACNPHEYIVLTDVAKYLDWIEKKISQFN